MGMHVELLHAAPISNEKAARNLSAFIEKQRALEEELTQFNRDTEQSAVHNSSIKLADCVGDDVIHQIQLARDSLLGPDFDEDEEEAGSEEEKQ